VTSDDRGANCETKGRARARYDINAWSTRRGSVNVTRGDASSRLDRFSRKIAVRSEDRDLETSRRETPVDSPLFVFEYSENATSESSDKLANSDSPRLGKLGGKRRCRIILIRGRIARGLPLPCNIHLVRFSIFSRHCDGSVFAERRTEEKSCYSRRRRCNFCVMNTHLPGSLL